VVLSGRFGATYEQIRDYWTYHELQAALDLLDAVDAAESFLRYPTE
jgi:hypothetical protein